MKPLPTLLLTAALAAAAGFASAQPANPIDALAQRLENDPKQREAAAALLQDFLLKPDPAGRRFAAADADAAALTDVARLWSSRADARRLAVLVAVAVPGSTGETRLRAALGGWAGENQITAVSEKRTAVAFFEDAARKAEETLRDNRNRPDIEAAIAANTGSVAVPSSRAAVERARAVKGAGAGVFGADRQAQDPNPGSGAQAAAGAAAAGAAAGAVGKAKPAGPIGPAAALPLSMRRGLDVAPPLPGDIAPVTGAANPAGASGVIDANLQRSLAHALGPVPKDGRVLNGNRADTGFADRVKDAFSHPMSDAYGFTFEGLEASPVSFRDSAPALAYAKKAPAGSFSNVTFYGHGAPGYMTVGQWGGDSGDIIGILKGKMKAGSAVHIKGCNTASIGGSSVNPGRGLSALTRRVLYFSIPYLQDRTDISRRELENQWDADLARDVSLGLKGVKVCGTRTFGLVGDRIPVVAGLMGRSNATDSDAIIGTKACYVDGKEVDN